MAKGKKGSPFKGSKAKGRRQKGGQLAPWSRPVPRGLTRGGGRK